MLISDTWQRQCEDIALTDTIHRGDKIREANAA